MNKKTWIFIGVVVAFIVGIIILFNFTKSDNLIGKTKIVNGIKFSNAKITKLSDKYVFYVTVTTSKDKVNITDFDATILDKKGNRIETLTGFVGDIDNNSKKEITIESNEDLSKAYEINYTIRINND
jgi:hypothetical protein